MPTKVKITIVDNSPLRAEIDELNEKMSQVDLAKWSLLLAKHILDIAAIDYHSIDEIKKFFLVKSIIDLIQ